MKLVIGQAWSFCWDSVHLRTPVGVHLKMSLEKFGDRIDGLTGLREFRGKHLEDVDHAVPDLQFDIDAGGACLVGKHDGVIEHGFAVADLNQQRRQSGEFGIKR